ncbi:MAG TPA: zf-HC2 domain-containing protein [Blastocatellia bacterium]|nr:zf-HC2 domain-containing protein [Blastocatellia bacterium]
MFGSHVNKQLSAYCNEELPPLEAQRVAEHLLQCERCRSEYDEIRFASRLARELSAVKAPSDLWREVESKLDELPVRANKQPFFEKSLFGMQLGYLATACAVFLLALCVAGFWLYRRQSQPDQPQIVDNHHLPAWEVERIEGLPKVGAQQISETGKLKVGQWLETDGNSRAALKVAEIGEVAIDPNSRVRLIEAKENDHRIELAKGKLSATIWAPPRLFFVETPTATAVDLGCAYTLEVDDAGASLLHVTLGYVSLVAGGHEAFIPAGAMCETRPGKGIGTPFQSDASITFRKALSRLDFEETNDQTALESVLREARKDDTLTLWHMLARVGNEAKTMVYDRLAKLSPPPKGVTKAGILSGDQKMLDRWWEELGYEVMR